MGAEVCAKGRAIGDLVSISILRQARAATSQPRSRTSPGLLAMPTVLRCRCFPPVLTSDFSGSLEDDILNTAAG